MHAVAGARLRGRLNIRKRATRCPPALGSSVSAGTTEPGLVRGARVVAIGDTAVGGNLDGLRDGRAFSVRYLRRYSLSKARAVEGPGTLARELNGVQVFWHNLRPEDEDPHPRGLLRGARWLLAPV